MRLASALFVASFLVSSPTALGQEVIPRPADMEKQRRSLTDWKTIAVDEGAAVQIHPSSEITLTFPEVTKKGALSFRMAFDGPKPPTGYSVGTTAIYLEMNAGFEFKGPVEMCVTFAPKLFPDDGADIRVLRRQDKNWLDETRTLDRDKNIVCAQLERFSILLLAVRTVPGLYDDLAATVRLVQSEELQQEIAGPILESREAALKSDRAVFEERLKAIRGQLAQATAVKVSDQVRGWLEYFLARIEARVKQAQTTP